ncbi:signal peptidase I [Sphingomonas populi]|uniref:Signal peptidase I n=1 Tax=Sphingomonas populi TaxID=2484750 RepID=A0A4Q6XY76_9SPHN|nr:signal peptidase I [Sphingomonas populi]RZF65410.1 signal peptidase I [Sphingomonas populi]
MSEDVALDPVHEPVETARPAPARRTDWWAEVRGIVWLVLAVLGFHTFIAKPFYIPSESMLPGLEIGDQLVVSKFPYGWSFISPTFHLLPFMHGRLFGRLPERGDVVIVTPPGTETDYIKRVIGLPGETLQVKGGVVFINGVALQRGPIHDALIPVDTNTKCSDDVYPGALETGADGKAYCRLPLVTETLPNGRHYDTVELGYSRGDDYGPVKIPANHVFLMGDNRDRSSDSRFPLAAPDLGLGGPVPWEYLGGRAEFITFSKSGGGTWNPLTWGQSFRGGRAGTSLHPARNPQ